MTLVACAGGPVLIVDADGRLAARLDFDHVLDDSGPAPQVTESGELLLTAPSGEVHVVDRRTTRLLGCFGYDVLPPAIDSEGALLFAAVCGGLSRFTSDGSSQPYPGTRDADLLPVVKPDGLVAVGALNERCSFFYDRERRLLGTLSCPAAFADAGGDRWVALGRNRVTGVTSTGVTLWTVEWSEPLDLQWGSLQPLVSPAGESYVPHPKGVLALDADGRTQFLVPLPAPATGLAPLSEGRMAAGLVGGRVYFLE